jgi:type VI secretion system protein ImpH
VLRDYFEVPVEVLQYVGRRVRLGEENHNQLGRRNTELGTNLILGASIWDRQSKFRVRLGPLPLDTLQNHLPNGNSYKPLNQVTRLYAGLEHDFDIQLRLKAQSVPLCRLRSEADDGIYLGWSSWLKTREFKDDVQDTVLPGTL